jgi:hypothetical protein
MPTVKISGSEFGETYHVAGAMLMTPLLAEGNGYYNHLVSAADGATPITNAQKTFFNYINYSTLVGTKISAGAEVSKADCTEKFIAPAFTNDAGTAKKRAQKGFFSAFAGGTDLLDKRRELTEFLNGTYNLPIPPAQINPKAIIWIRNIGGQRRNMTKKVLEQVIATLSANATPINEIIFVGDTDVVLPTPGQNQTFYDLIGFFSNAAFTPISGRGGAIDADFSFATQLLMFWLLQQEFNLKVIIGMKSGAMDGPAMIGIPTFFFDEDTGAAGPTRMAQLATAIPNMERVTFPTADYDSSVVAKSSMPIATIAALEVIVAALP